MSPILTPSLLVLSFELIGLVMVPDVLVFSKGVLSVLSAAVRACSVTLNHV